MLFVIDLLPAIVRPQSWFKPERTPFDLAGSEASGRRRVNPAKLDFTILVNYPWNGFE